MRLAAEEGDRFIASYRNHGHLLAAGADPASMMAELAGRRDGLSGGKGGSMHMFAPDLGFFGGHGIVGAQVSLGTGLAFAGKYRDDGRVAVVFFGDGAADQGQAAESFAMAARWRLPVVYVIENNRAPPFGQPDARRLSRRGAAFDIPGEEVDGACVASVRAAGEEAMARARAGGGPTILDLRTEPFRGHALPDPAQGRRMQDAAEAADPLRRQREKILREGLASAADLKHIDLRVRAQIAAAAEHAATSPQPDASALATDILI
jgi:pyruvate dehydrogenase E1 component alpha subunit